MTPFYEDAWLQIWGGDCRTVLAELPSDSVDCVVTSPPYWGLRDYGAEGQLGLERTPGEYVANLVAVFAEVRRVLKPSGTCWLNLGDSYASHDPGGYRQGEFLNSGGREPVKGQARNRAGNYRPGGLKPKDLVGIPWRTAFALQADGWYLRSDIIWSKPNPMPESVTDRPTKSHEYLFLLTKSARYYFDADAVREGWADDRNGAPGGHKPAERNVGGRTDGLTRPGQDWVAPEGRTGRNLRSVWTIATVPYRNTTQSADDGGHRDTLSPDCPVHSLRAIRRTLQTDGDDALLDHLRSRSPHNGNRPAPMPADGLFANLGLDSLDASPSIPDSLPAGSSLEPILGSAHESRTLTPPTSADGQESDAGSELHTSRTPTPTSEGDQGEQSVQDGLSATGRSGFESRTSVESGPLGSASLAPESSTPDTDAQLDLADRLPRKGASSTAEDSVAGDPADQTTGRTSGKCTCSDYSASHFAVFPPELPERCIKAGSSERGVCAECGAPWERAVERVVTGQRHISPKDVNPDRNDGPDDPSSRLHSQYFDDQRRTTGWRPTCAHTTEPTPAVILDPFAGSGTVGMVANRLSRRAVLIDLNPEYLKQQMRRNAQAPLGLSA